MAKSAVFIDLDRTLLCRASGQALNRALVEEGVLPEGRSLPGDRILYAVNDRLGENLVSMGLVRAAARVAKGWRQDEVQAAGRRAVPGADRDWWPRSRRSGWPPSGPRATDWSSRPRRRST